MCCKPFFSGHDQYWWANCVMRGGCITLSLLVHLKDGLCLAGPDCDRRTNCFTSPMGYLVGVDVFSPIVANHLIFAFGNYLASKVMPFDIVTRTVLECYTTHTPTTEDVWYGPWTTILTTLFPSTQEYIVTPQRRLLDDSESPDLIIEVVKMATVPLTFRSVLIVKIKNTQHWKSGIPALQRQLNRQTEAAFAGKQTHHFKMPGP